MRTYLLAMVVIAVGLLVAAPTTALAQDDACDVILEDDVNVTTGPGGELADAIGDQRSEIASELDDRRFEARLDNATTEEERATNVSAELERIETHLDALETCWESHETAHLDGNVADQLDPAEIETVHEQAQSVHTRFNDTAAEATNLSAPVRDEHGISVESLNELEQRIETMREATTQAVE